MAKNIILRKVTLSFPALAVPRVNKLYPNNPPKFEATLLLDKKSPQVKELEAIVGELLASVDPKRRASIKNGIKDGDKPENARPETAGKIIVKATAVADKPPFIADVTGRDRSGDKLFVSQVSGGNLVNADIRVFYSEKFNVLSCDLNGIQKIGEGTPFGDARVNRFTSEEESFAEDTGAVPPAPSSTGSMFG